MELNKFETKAVELLTPHLNNLQSFVDERIVAANVSMTAANVQKNFYKEYSCALLPAEFIQGFRIAVRADKITGIIGVKKSGYRSVDATSKTVNKIPTEPKEKKEPKVKEPKAVKEPKQEENKLACDAANVQAVVDKYIQGTDKLTAAKLYDKYNDEFGTELTADEFVKCFRLLIKDGKITGLENAYRAGYKRAGVDGPEEEIEEESEDEPKEGKCEIIIDERRKLVATDPRNWQLMIKMESGSWHNNGYFTSIQAVLHNLAAKLIDDDMKQGQGFDIKQLLDRVTEAETKITSMLTKAIEKVNGYMASVADVVTEDSAQVTAA